ncbi:MAG TPA: hypothetical protein VJC16_03645 [Candidatus Nanoarchaeia archaeon]|nr:hypothetical protein [Candidatus Nanoarchaeia archaeon]
MAEGSPQPDVFWAVEKPMLRTAAIALVFLFALELVAYYGFFRGVPGFFAAYGYYIALLVVAVVGNSIAVWHIKAYRQSFSHTIGMMIGMTIGMSAGFTIGMLLGATNGMFIGSIAGTLIGMLAGSYAGNCCGLMGAMEGMMAGLMGGTMGAMVSVMTLNDHVRILVPLLTGIVLVIIIGLLVMIYQEEIRNRPHARYQGYPLLPFLTVLFIITMSLTFVMVYGPRSLLFG